jgi:glycosyltransferase involved in cell wall biosynthesis
MKVIFATYRFDPTNPDLGSSMDYECYSAIRGAGFDVHVIGPVTNTDTWPERVEQSANRLYSKSTWKKGLKFPIATAWRASRMLEKTVQELKPDLVYSRFFPFFVFYGERTPYVFELDATFIGENEQFPQYGRLALAISIWQEKRTFARAAAIITNSTWSRNLIIQKYKISGDRVYLFPMLAPLPASVIPSHIEVRTEKRLESPLRMLLVGRDYYRKGIEMAIRTVELLNEKGLPSELVICGLKSRPENVLFVRFVGPYQKSDTLQLAKYVGWYKWANFLLHPARFEAAGMVPSEAAAFGTPTITNDTGGLSTTVAHGESGIVLPRSSRPEDYVDAIQGLVSRPEDYYSLCESTHKRYERELNSAFYGKRLVEVLQTAAQMAG